MEINVELKRNFVNAYNKMQNNYGEEIAKVNGFSSGQLSYTDFIDNFVDTDTVADVSVDGNANSGHKDIVTLMNEMPKPHQKLLAFNKIHYEINKKYGFQTANEWLKNEWDGHLYMHDANSSTFVHYCFRGDTKILTKNGIKRLDELVGQNIKVINKNKGWEDATVKHFGKDVLWKLTLERYGVTKDIYVTGNHIWYVRENDKVSEISTEHLTSGMKIPFITTRGWTAIEPSPFGIAHGFFTGDGCKGHGARANFCGDKEALIPYFTPANISGNEKEKTIYGIPNYFHNLPSLDETLSYLYGWLIGYFAADGNVDEKGRCTISSVQYENLEHVRNVLCILGMPVNEIRYQDRISNLTNEMGRVYVLTISSEYLRDNFFIRPMHKKNHKPNMERKNRNWIVRSVENTGIVDDVYCAVVEGTQSFTLDNNVLTHNCFAYDLKDLAERGLFFIENFNAEPPQHLETFIDFVKEFVSYVSNRSSGACGLPNLIPYMYYFWRKDVKSNYFPVSPEKYARQSIQRIIYALNQPYTRNGVQSAFTNTSIFDHPYLEALFGGAEFPDGTFMVDELEEIMDFQKLFLEEMAKIRSQNMMTFPVNSISLLRVNGKFVDEEFARYACKHNMKWNDSNLFIDDSVTSLSNCCFDGSQMTLTRNKDVVNFMSFADLYETDYVNRDDFTVLHNGEWVKGKIVRLPKRPLFKVTTSNNKTIIVTDNHLNPTQRGDIETVNLTTDDYLLFSSFQYVVAPGLCETFIPTKLFYDEWNCEMFDDKPYFKIESIEKYESDDDYVYCFEMPENDPYFTLPNGIITHNCRLKSNIKDLGFFNSIGGTALKVGSVKVNTINLARLALENKTEESYLAALEKMVILDLKALDCVRHIIKRNVEKGLLNNFSSGLVDFAHLYSTVGFIGIYETMKTFGYITKDEFDNTYYTKEAEEFGRKIFDVIHSVKDKFAEDKDYQINCEQIPGETAAAKLMKKDLFFFPDDTVTDLPLYGNQFIPLGIKTTMQERIRIASLFDSFCNGGSILHVNVEAPFSNFDQAWDTLNYIADQGVTYFAFNTKIQACKQNHAFFGKVCPICGGEVDTEYSRIVGFYTPVKTYSKERKAEYKMREWEDVNAG